LSAKQELSVRSALAVLVPNTKVEDFSITKQVRDDNGHLHISIRLSLRVSDHGFDPSDVSAVSDLEAQYRGYIYQAATTGALSSAFSNSLQTSGAFVEQKDVKMDLMSFDTSTIAKGPIEVDDDMPLVSSAEVIDRDWMERYSPASADEVRLYTFMYYLTDVVAALGYVGALITVVYGLHRMRTSYQLHRVALQSDIESATQSFAARSRSTLRSIGEKALKALDDFSDYVVEGEVSVDSEGRALIPEVVLPLENLLDLDEETKNVETKKSKKKLNLKQDRRIKLSRHKDDNSGDEESDEY